MVKRKIDHIKLAETSIPISGTPDTRFNYEPMLSAHPFGNEKIEFLGKTMNHPLWISSITGGSADSGRINHYLAEAAAEFGLGIGLGSCRSLLKNNKYFEDFNLRPIMGENVPFFANIGIAQIEELIDKRMLEKIHELVINRLQADGLIIHVNPVQEWLQPEGDLFKRPPIDTIRKFLEDLNHKYKIIIKEVGQGIGPDSLERLLKLEIDCIEFGAYGGTNFPAIEINRNKNAYSKHLKPLTSIGHNANEMVEVLNNLVTKNPYYCNNLIISGGINNFLDGYYFIKRSTIPAIYGMANPILRCALISKQELFDFVRAEIEGYKFASRFLSLKKI